jgi:hypothetical protein
LAENKILEIGGIEMAIICIILTIAWGIWAICQSGGDDEDNKSLVKIPTGWNLVIGMLIISALITMKILGSN